MLASILPALLFSLLPLVSAGVTSVGCVNQARGALLVSPFTAINDADCATQCQSRLRGTAAETRITYSYFFTNSQCQCTDTSPFAVDLALCDAQHTSAYRIGTSFSLQSCNAVAPNQLVTQSLNACFDMCRSSFGVQISSAVDPPTGGRAWRCGCLATPTTFPGPSVGCGPGDGTAYTYIHSGIAQASQLNRRRRNHVKKAEDYCPGSLTACNIKGSSGYECIDTSNELESCGGCLHGQYSASGVQGAQGVNCALLDSNLYGSVTCKAGQCVDEF